MNKLIYLWFAVKTAFCSCHSDHKMNGFERIKSHYKIIKTGVLPDVANESSGLVKGNNPNSFWTNNDSGGKPELYKIDSTGKLLSVKKVDNAQNTDWEDLTSDENGTIYIGDFGNNSNTRRNLNVYKVPLNKPDTEKITFSYADQTEFPPSEDKLNYDCEAFFYSRKNLYLFSKNRSPANHYVRLYQMPSEQGNYTISPIDSIRIKTQVTSADISPDGKTFALLTYGKILLFGIEEGKINFKRPLGCFRIVRKQTEALIFLNNSDMLVTNEQKQIFRFTYR
ncbi:hypothetical protein [Dyadobacter sp. NIV53]|uniref:hypothetical protein n=1 Tax=Dyadobacter sp. NIV53 TaxID=2861765 RepID=UPI001C86DF6F|nr:hypothetical protein [Dyadobacter sp. NIV53]